MKYSELAYWHKKMYIQQMLVKLAAPEIMWGTVVILASLISKKKMMGQGWTYVYADAAECI